MIPAYRIELRAIDGGMHTIHSIVLRETHAIVSSRLQPYGEGEADLLVREYVRGPLKSTPPPFISRRPTKSSPVLDEDL